VTEARQVALGADPPTYTGTSTSTSAPPTTSTSASSTPPPSSTSTPTPAPKSNNTGAIVGGVVGGLLGVALIAVLMIWLLCGKRIRERIESRRQPPAQEKNTLGQAFSTPPAQPPTLANIVVPVPLRSYPVRPTLQSYGSSGSQNTNLDSNYGYTTLHSPKPSEDHHNLDPEDRPIDRIEMGSNMTRSNTHRNRHRSSTSSTGALALLTRITSLRWRRHVPTNSDGSAGSAGLTSTGMVSMDSGGGIDLEGARHAPNDQSNVYRRMVAPVPFTLPNHAEEPEILDISNPENNDLSRSRSQASSYPSAAEEKRRLKQPPAYTGPPPEAAVAGRREHVSQEISMEPRASLARLEVSSRIATAGSRTVASESNEGHSPLYSPYSERSGQQQQPDRNRTRPHSDSRTNSNSVPSNFALPASPWEQAPQTASSGVLDYSPVPPVPNVGDNKSAQTPSNLRFTVTNPGHHVEM
jgi:hypothetical protein